MNEENLNYVKEKLKDNVDVKYRTINSDNGQINIIFIDNLCDSKFISEYIIGPIIRRKHAIKTVSDLESDALLANSIGDVKDKEDMLLHILSGDVVIITNFYDEIIFCEAKGYVRRSVSIPITEAVIKGPREGFTEAFVDNISLIRRKAKNADLKFESVFLGEKSRTVVVVAYLKGTAPEKLVNNVKGQIKDMTADYILDSNYIEEKLKSKKTAFDTIGYSEKADIVVNHLFRGKVAVIVDGTPFVAIAPYFFYENFHMPDDYYLNSIVVNATRVLRWLGFIISTFLPGLYISIITYHVSLIPSSFVFRLAISRSGIPFPTIIELLIMMFFFQILREAGVRLPQPVGQAMSIVGALILGQSAVEAGLTSEITIIIVALSSISSFLTPNLYGPVSMWSIIIALFSAFCGLPGFFTGVFVLLAHIASLRSVGYLYTFPIGTAKILNQRDRILRGELEDTTDNILQEDDLL
ncbi:spore germination protein [Clostridium felsineum]|uniref:spore germination protein n=1 Tax=Clostridium felsineum TaxID=36839 RepID=UPI00098C6F24|nr:spore germination protein [Clostridium felsineum]URZ01780.1 Spore germination protein B1 [Clostridium felsineum]